MIVWLTKPVVISSRIAVLLIPGLSGDSPLAQLVKELDLCLYLCLSRRLQVRDAAEPINNFSLPTTWWGCHVNRRLTNRMFNIEMCVLFQISLIESETNTYRI